MQSFPATTQDVIGDPTKSRLIRSFTRLENQRIRMLRELDGWPAERLSIRPNSDGWSALEVVDHLIRAERLACSMAFQLLPERMEVSAMEKLRLHLLVCAFRFPIRVAVPSAVHMITPGEPRPLRELSMEWELERKRLRELLGSPLAARADRAAIRHPVVGRIDLHGTLLFASVHLKHHTFQIQRLQTSLLAPS